MMNEQLFGNRIRQALNRRSGQIAPESLERLRAAREQALSKQKLEQSARVLSLAGLPAGGEDHGWAGFSLRWLLPALVLATGISAIYVWQQSFRVAEVEEVDTRLLTDDLPIDAYLDKGFQAWLKKVSTEE